MSLQSILYGLIISAISSLLILIIHENFPSIGKRLFYILFPLLSTLFLCIYNFCSSFEAMDVSWDGFIYLTMARYKTQSPLLDPIRSPIVAYIMAPTIYSMRMEMIFFLVSSVFLLYLIVEKISHNMQKASLAALLFGSNWWLIHYTTLALTELPALFFLLLTLYLILNLYGRSKSNLGYISGFFAGLSFIIRFEVILPIFFLLYLIHKFMGKKRAKEFLTTFLFMAIVFEFISCYFFFGYRVYSPWEFMKIWIFHHIAALDLIATVSTSSYYFIVLLSTNPIFITIAVVSLIRQFFRLEIDVIPLGLVGIILLPFSLFIAKEFRWILASIPFMAMISADILDYSKDLDILGKHFKLKALTAKKTMTIGFILIAVSSLIFNFNMLRYISYPSLNLEGIEWPMGGDLCSNYPTPILYFTGKPCANLFWKDAFPAFSLEVAQEVASNNDYVIFFELKERGRWISDAPSYLIGMMKEKDIVPGFNHPPDVIWKFKVWLDRNMILLSKKDTGSFNIYIYKNPYGRGV